MATENFTTYTEVDEDGDITVTSSRLTVASMRRDAVSYVRDDKGAGHFGDFEHLIAVSWPDAFAAKAAVGTWGVSNGSSTMQDMGDNNEGLDVHIWDEYEIMTIVDYTNDNEDTHNYASEALWLTIERAGTTGTCKLYDDGEARTSLHDTLSITVGATTYRYVFGIISRDGSTDVAATGSGYAENLDLQEAAAGWAHKYMGVANASIGKINGVAIANIGKVSGVA